MVGPLASLYIQKTLRIGAIYRIEAPELISISLNHYDQIRTGIKNSYVNDLHSFLLVHPDE